MLCVRTHIDQKTLIPAYIVITGLVICHVFGAADLCLVFLCAAAFVIAWFDIGSYSMRTEIPVVLEAFVSCICHDSLILRTVLLFQGIQQWRKRIVICPVGVDANARNEFTVNRELHIVSRLQLTISHVIVLHMHKCCIRIGL